MHERAYEQGRKRKPSAGASPNGGGQSEPAYSSGEMGRVRVGEVGTAWVPASPVHSIVLTTMSVPRRRDVTMTGFFTDVFMPSNISQNLTSGNPFRHERIRRKHQDAPRLFPVDLLEHGIGAGLNVTLGEPSRENISRGLHEQRSWKRV